MPKRQASNAKAGIAYAMAYVQIRSISFYMYWFCHALVIDLVKLSKQKLKSLDKSQEIGEFSFTLK